jgi:hypothetical protein
MVMRVQHVEGEYRVVLTPEAMEALNLTDGASVEIVPVAAAQPEHRYMTVEEMLDAYQRTEHLHLDTYRELAK